MNCIGRPRRCVVTHTGGGAQMQMREHKYEHLPIRLRSPHHHLLPSTDNAATDVDNPQIPVAMPCVDILQSHATPLINVKTRALQLTIHTQQLQTEQLALLRAMLQSLARRAHRHPPDRPALTVVEAVAVQPRSGLSPCRSAHDLQYGSWSVRTLLYSPAQHPHPTD